MAQEASLEAIVAASLARPAPPEIAAMADALLARHGADVLAVLAYGSSLRGVDPSQTLIDLYVLTGTIGGVSGSALARWGCRLVPPNVHYAETVLEGSTLRAKYAILPLAVFERRCGPSTSNPYFWARFSQPCRLIHVRDETARARVVAACAEAVRTMLAEAGRIASPGADPLALWSGGFAQTYRTELRPEGPDRARQIVEANQDYYRAVTAAAGPLPALARAPWAWRRIGGKGLTVLRLVKAAFTFQGGADYLAWKIARHSGAPVPLKDWQRRHPILGALSLLPGLIRRGAVR